MLGKKEEYGVLIQFGKILFVFQPTPCLLGRLGFLRSCLLQDLIGVCCQDDGILAEFAGIDPFGRRPFLM